MGSFISHDVRINFTKNPSPPSFDSSILTQKNDRDLCGVYGIHTIEVYGTWRRDTDPSMISFMLT